MAAALALAALGTAPVVAQDVAADDGLIEVTGVEYAFTGLPTTVPVGTELGFTNGGAEVHEMILARIADDTTESLEELLGMEAQGRDPVEEGLVEIVGDGPLFAGPGTSAEGTLTLDREGTYVVLCFIPQGLTDMSLLEALGPDTDPADVPAEIQEIMANPPHVALGMVQGFSVTPEGTEAGPLPSDMAATEGDADASPVETRPAP